MDIIKTIAKPEGLQVTKAEIDTVTSYFEGTLGADDIFVNWSTSAESNVPIGDTITMNEDKILTPFVQAKPVVEWGTIYGSVEGWKGRVDDDHIISLSSSTDNGEYYFSLNVYSGDPGKYMIGIIGRDDSDSAWGGDFGEINLSEVLQATNSVQSYHSKDGKKLKYLKVYVGAEGSSGYNMRFVVYNANGVPVKKTDYVESGQEHQLCWRKIGA